MSQHSLCVVSYLNSKPFVEGLRQAFTPGELDVRELIPSACAQAFASGQCQIGLVPVGSLLDMPHVHLLPPYCIGADGEVDSVFVVAQQPIHTLTQLWLDPHSRTSNGLARILFRFHWQQAVSVHQAVDDRYHTDIHADAGGVIIGDRAIALRHQFAYVYDLAAAWKDWTGLPFAFAVWATHPELVAPDLRQRIVQAFDWGMAHREAIATRWAPHFGMTSVAASAYLHHAIDYHLDEPKRQALQLYLHHLAVLEGATAPVVH